MFLRYKNSDFTKAIIQQGGFYRLVYNGYVYPIKYTLRDLKNIPDWELILG